MALMTEANPQSRLGYKHLLTFCLKDIGYAWSAEVTCIRFTKTLMLLLMVETDGLQLELLGVLIRYKGILKDQMIALPLIKRNHVRHSESLWLMIATADQKHTARNYTKCCKDHILSHLQKQLVSNNCTSKPNGPSHTVHPLQWRKIDKNFSKDCCLTWWPY